MTGYFSEVAVLIQWALEERLDKLSELMRRGTGIGQKQSLNLNKSSS